MRAAGIRSLYLPSPLETRSVTLPRAVGDCVVVSLHVTSPVFRFNPRLFPVNLDVRVTGARHTLGLAASKPPA